jgi:hypothetical protein
VCFNVNTSREKKIVKLGLDGRIVLKLDLTGSG